MDWNIIVASSDADQLDELLNGAQEIATRLRPGTAFVRTARSIEEVLAKRNLKTGLLIVAASLPHRSGSDDERESGMSFVKSLGSEAASLVGRFN